MEDTFYNDNNSYVLCRYDVKNNLNTNICYFSKINYAYKYIINNYNIIKSDDFLESYEKFLLGIHFANGHNMLIPKNYVLSFIFHDYLYELYGITENAEYVLLIFNTGTNLIGYVEGFNNYESAIFIMKEEYKEVYEDEDNENIFYDENISLIKHNDIVFGMIFKCIKY